MPERKTERMTLNFPITPNDYYEVRSYEFMRMSSFRTMVIIVRIAGVIAIGLTAYVLRPIIADMPAMIVFLTACLAWIFGFPYVMKLRFKAHAKKEIRRLGMELVDEEVALTFDERFVRQQDSKGKETKFSYNHIIWVEDAKKYVLIYDENSDTPFIIPSKEIFKSDEERKQFTQDLRADCNIKVEDRKNVLKAGPRLKMRKK